MTELTDIELEDKLRENYVKAVVGEKKARTLEQALQEALDNTTVERPGTPNYPDDEQGEPEPEWI